MLQCIYWLRVYISWYSGADRTSWCDIADLLRFLRPAGQIDTSIEDEGVPNLVDEAAWFEWAGVGVAREELPRLFAAMTALKTEHGLKAVRFFGKVLGTKADYYVVEGTYVPGAEPTLPTSTHGATPPEAPGMGLNTHIYFAASDPSSKFVRLPDVLPETIVAACKIKKYFTGDLAAPVKAYPTFPGKEADYLRAQIARIAAATVLVPAGKFAFDEEAETEPKPLIKLEDFEAKPAAEMAEADSWCHLRAGVLKIGRATNLPIPEDAEEEDAPELEEEVPPLAPISSDAPVADPLPESGTETPAWSIKLYCPQARDGAVVIAKSHRWPGAYSAVVKGKHANLYVGYGAEASATPFTPTPPPPIMGEAEDVGEETDVSLAAENEVLKAIDEERMRAEAAVEEPQEE